MMHYNVSVPLMKIFPTKGLNKCTSVSIRKSGISIKLLDLLKVRMKNALLLQAFASNINQKWM